ncbi:TolC family outer membrane protein [Methylomonas sp. AM2-LC]|uniref:TolC family outer membrane protein n=1 Tax=Methylomonas sp. AM2-LC TaxID=3153301 RepID=UPI00326764B9
MRKLLFTFLIALIPLKIGFAQDLLETYALAKSNDPDIRATEFRNQATAETKDQSIAQMLPNLTLVGSDGVNQQSVNSFLGTTNQHYTNAQVVFNLKMPVFHWDHWVQLEQSDNKIAQSEAQLQAKSQNLIRRTAEAYFNVLAAQDEFKYSTAEKLALAEQLAQAKQRFEVGTVAITDVYEAQAGFDRSVAGEIEAQKKLDNSKEALREVIGDNPTELRELQGLIPLPQPVPEDIAIWSDAADSNNFSIIAQLNQSEYVRKSIEIQQAKHIPTLDIIGQYTNINNGSVYGYRGDYESVLLQMNVSIYEGGVISSRTRQYTHEYEAALEDLIKLRRSVGRQVKDAYRGVVSNISKIKALEATIKSAEMAVEAVEAGFKIGTRTMVDVVTAQRNLYRIKSDYARSRYDYLIEGVKLKEASGSLSEQDLQQINHYLVGIN